MTGRLIVVDFDDTLAPTTAFLMSRMGDSVDSLPRLTRDERRCMNVQDELATMLFSRLVAFAPSGNVWILTAASLSWVQSCLCYLPKLSALLESASIRTISARNEMLTIDSWKLISLYMNAPFDVTEIVGIGDSPFDRYAVMEFGRIRNVVWKSILLTSQPTSNALKRQLEYILEGIDSMMEHHDSFDLRIQDVFDYLDESSMVPMFTAETDSLSLKNCENALV